MSKLIKPVSPQDLQNWNVPTDSKIDFYDGKILVVSDGEEESSFGVAAKAGIALLGGIAIFTHAPFVAAVMGVYAAYKVTETVKGLYGGESDLTTRLLQDLDFEVETQALLPVATASPIGMATKLGAIEVQNSPSASLSALFNPAIDLGQNPQSALIAGVPGSGKGILVSNAVRVLRQKHQALIVMMIDPKGDPKEKGYWQGVVNIYRSMNLMNCDDPDEGASWLLSCMDEFRKLPAPKLLIFDEMLAASVEISLAHKDFKAPQRMKKFVSGIIAQGDSQGVWVWAMSQSVQVADLGFNGGVRGNLRVIGIISPKNTTAIEALTSTQLIPKPVGGMDELRAIMKASPVDRAFYDGKISRWLPMPKLENHSGFDRDNRTIEANPTISKKQAETYQDKPAETPNQNDEPTFYPTPVELLNNSFNLASVTPSHEETESAIEQTTDDIFVKFADSLTHESQANLKSFVLWLRKKRGEEVSFEQIKSSWAKNNNVGRGKETLMPIIYAAKSKRLLTLLPNSKWKVCE